ncbi:hypothetical+protein [Methylocapsa aurea]
MGAAMADGQIDIAGIVDKIRDIALPLAGGATPAAILAWLAGRRRATAEAAKIVAEAAKTDAEAEAIGAEALTARFKLLIDGYERRIAEMTEQLRVLTEGYEGRIKDLASEVHSLRDEVKELRKALDARPRPAPR